MAVVSCLLFCGIKVALCELGRPLYGGMGQSLRTQEKGQALTYRGVLSLAGVIYLGQFTRNYTQTTKRGLLTTNKG